ncbi:MAG: hypothetical protein CMF60_02845 [Magnetococcales bacterium]|nr:hypothetical protein [Magnetococcales bacterium]|tara:strand:- start:7568 stop:8005 length:438 start_codon:yes stop_codon:yes gene_type:complete
MSRKQIDTILNRLQTEIRQLTSQTSKTRFWVHVPIVSCFVPAESVNKVNERRTKQVMYADVCALLKEKQLDDSNFVEHVNDLIEAKKQAALDRLEFAKSAPFAGMALDTCDFSEEPRLPSYAAFALMCFKGTLTSEQVSKLKAYC